MSLEAAGLAFPRPSRHPLASTPRPQSVSPAPQLTSAEGQGDVQAPVPDQPQQERDQAAARQLLLRQIPRHQSLRDGPSLQLTQGPQEGARAKPPHGCWSRAFGVQRGRSSAWAATLQYTLPSRTPAVCSGVLASSCCSRLAKPTKGAGSPALLRSITLAWASPSRTPGAHWGASQYYSPIATNVPGPMQVQPRGEGADVPLPGGGLQDRLPPPDRSPSTPCGTASLALERGSGLGC